MFKIIPSNFILIKLSLGIVISLGIFVLMPAKTAMAQDWLEGGWEYRKPVTITNNTGSSQSDYQVRVTLNTAFSIAADKMLSDCADIRFTDSGGTTTISHWLESNCNSAFTSLWVEVPSIPTGTSTIFAYYGSSTAATVSNGDSTFVFFDDFSGTTINTTEKWTEVDSASNFITQNNRLIIANGTGAWTTTGLYSQANFTRASLIAQAKYKSSCGTGAIYHDTTMLWWKDTSTSINHPQFIYALYFNKKALEFSNLNIYESGTSKATVGSFGCGTQYWVRQILKASSGAITQISTDGKRWTTLYDSNVSNTSPLKVGFTHYQGGTVEIDDFIVRKYASPEPTTKVGGEIAREVSCRPPISGNHTITSSCSFENGASGIYGVEEGNLIIESDATLLIQAGQVFVWTPGYSVIINGSIAIEKTPTPPFAQGRKGYLWMDDADLNGYPATTSQYFGNTSGDKPAECSGCRRRKEMFTMTEVDVNDGNACADIITNTCGTDTGNGVCSPKAAGWYDNLSVCQECDGSSIEPVNSTIDTRRTGCTGCYYCSGAGSCLSCSWAYDNVAHYNNTWNGTDTYCKPSLALGRGYNTASSRQCDLNVKTSYVGSTYNYAYRMRCVCN